MLASLCGRQWQPGVRFEHRILTCVPLVSLHLGLFWEFCLKNGDHTLSLLFGQGCVLENGRYFDGRKLI